jgi:hypothetical protein
MINSRIAVLAVALSFTAAAFCFGETKKTEPKASPSPVKTEKAAAPKKEAPKMANPHLGTWKLNETKSKIPAGMGKNTTVTYTEQKDNIKVAVVGVDKDGKPTKSVWVGKFDGKAYPVKGNLPYDAVAYKVINERTNHITTLKDKKIIVWTGEITVSADGKSRTVTINGSSADGKKFKGKAVYDKA